MIDWSITAGDARTVLAGWPAGAVQCVVTSVPYYLQRAYGTEPQIWGGDPACDHSWEARSRRLMDSGGAGVVGSTLQGGKATQAACRATVQDATCAVCGAWRGELGSEPTIAQYCANMVEVFRAVRRVLAPTGTLFLNIGDSYSNAGRAGSRGTKRGAGKPGWTDGGALGDKQLLLIPARVALALQADGWVLRNDVIWEKPNAMPSSVKDRLSTSYEHVFLFSKQPRYFYDAAAIAEPTIKGAAGSTFTEGKTGVNGQGRVSLLPREEHETRNARDVWSIPTEPYEGAHFAVMPTELARRCILAGTSAAGQCAACGAPWARVTEHTSSISAQTTWNGRTEQLSRGGPSRPGNFIGMHTETTGWAPTCRCDAGAPVPQVVADPFTGAGTVGVVALRHGRAFWGAELNEAYCTMARARIVGDSPLFNRPAAEGAA